MHVIERIVKKRKRKQKIFHNEQVKTQKNVITMK